MADKSVSMKLNETLELEYLVEQRTDERIDVEKDPSNGSSSTNYLSRDSFVFSPDSTGTYKFKIDGQTIEVNVSDIPDPSEIQIRYVAENQTTAYSDGDTVSTLIASKGADITATGEPKLRTNIKNGFAVIDYDGSNDAHEGSLSSSYSQPTHRFVVFKFQSFSGINDYIVSTQTDPQRHDLFADGSDNEYGAIANSGITGGSPNTEWHIASVLYNGGSSYIRIDGTEIASGDVGSGGYSDIVIGYLPWNSNGNFANMYLSEFIDYGTDKSQKESEIENYLANKYNISI